MLGDLDGAFIAAMPHVAMAGFICWAVGLLMLLRWGAGLAWGLGVGRA